MVTPKLRVSPRIATVTREVAAGNPTALDRFWHEVTEQGAPLVEPTPDDPRSCLVTFLWRAIEETKNVVVLPVACWFDGVEPADIARHHMTRLPTTDLWYRTYCLPNELRVTYRLSPNDSVVPLEEVKDWQERTATWQLDPLNPRRLVTTAIEDANPWGPQYDYTTQSLLELPAAAAQPWVARRSASAEGRVERDHVWSTRLNNERRVWVYTPPGYRSDGTPYPLVLLLDGWHYRHVQTAPTTFDNLLADGSVPPFVAVLIDSLDLETRLQEMSCSLPFTDFLAQEVLPWVRARVSVTTDPESTLIGGLSAGGLAASFASLRYPELFGNVLSQSGWFEWKPEQDREYEWLTRQYAARSRLPQRFYLDVGLFEDEPNRPPDAPGMLVANRHTRTVLEAKGYAVSYAEFVGGHSHACWRGTLADGLRALLGAAAVRTM